MLTTWIVNFGDDTTFYSEMNLLVRFSFNFNKFSLTMFDLV